MYQSLHGQPLRDRPWHPEKVGAKLTTLSKKQADYIGVPVTGPFKSDHYRY